MIRPMLTRILTMMRKDALTGGRDQITLYMLLSPLLLGLMIALLMPVLEDARPGFVVSEALHAVDRDALAAHGAVEVVADREAVIRRVLARDDVTGVVPSQPGAPAGAVEIIVQGDEPEPLWGLARAIIERGPADPSDAPEAERGRSELRLITAAIVGYCVVVIVGLMLGFAILEEKTTNTHVAFVVSPLRFVEYLGAKLILAGALALVMIVPALALPLGLALDWSAVLIMVIASLPFAVSLGLCVGVFAKDQLSAVAVMKGLLPVWTSLPVLGFVLPDRWLWTQFPFANHWGVQGLVHALGDGVGIASYAGLSVATGLPVLLGAAWLLRRKLGFA